MISLRLAACAALFAVTACSAPATTRATQPQPQQRRVISLIPSLTEDLCAIGAGAQLVGVSSYTRDVPCALRVAVVGGFSSIDAERIVTLHPDLVVGIPAQRREVVPLQHAGIRVELLGDDSYADLFTDVARLGTLTGRVPAARRLIARLRAQTASLRARTRAFKRRPSIFVVLGTGPIYTAGPDSYISTLIAIAGGRNAVTALPGAYAAYSPEALLRLQPDAIVSDPSIGLTAVLGREPWSSLRAVRAGRVWLLSDAALLERPGPRYNEGLAWLVKHLTPLATAR